MMYSLGPRTLPNCAFVAVNGNPGVRPGCAHGRSRIALCRLPVILEIVSLIHEKCCVTGWVRRFTKNPSGSTQRGGSKRHRSDPGVGCSIPYLIMSFQNQGPCHVSFATRHDPPLSTIPHSHNGCLVHHLNQSVTAVTVLRIHSTNGATPLS